MGDAKSIPFDRSGNGPFIYVKIPKTEWKYITRELQADIVVLENETLFDSRKFRTMGDFGKVMEDQFLSLLSYVAEQERKKNRQRQTEGIEISRKEGVKFGRPKKQIDANFVRVYDQSRSGVITATAAMKLLDMKSNTFYRRVMDTKVSNTDKRGV
jgi:DNA invertase Pin-like site-specific DNA recombinase